MLKVKLYVVLFLFLFITLVSAIISTNPSITAYVSHGSNSHFSEGYGLYLNQRTLTVSDSLVYHTAYYSLNASSWVPFDLSGTPIERSNIWLSSSASYELPPTILQSGVHYVIVYSCTYQEPSWDCHANDFYPSGGWQLKIINNTSPSVPATGGAGGAGGGSSSESEDEADEQESEDNSSSEPEPEPEPPACLAEAFAWWKFEGNAQDETGTHHGTTYSTTTAQGIVNDSFDFDGTSSRVEIPFDTALRMGNTGTISLWVRPETVPVSTHLLYGYGGRQYGSGNLIAQNGPDLRIYWGGSSTLLLMPDVFTINNWHHITLTNNDGNIVVYVNGTEQATATSFGEITSTYNVFMGSTDEEWYFDGQIDEVMLFDRALTINEVQEIYNYLSNGTGATSSTECGDTTCDAGEHCGSCLADCPCQSGYECQTDTCVQQVTCTSQDELRCYNGDVYWYDSCDVREGLVDDCSPSQNCVNGACTEQAQGTLTVGTPTSIPDWATAELELIERYTVFVETFFDRFVVNPSTGQTCVDTFYWYNWDDILEGMERFPKLFLIHSTEELREQHAQIYKYYHQYAIDQGWIVDGFYNNPYDAEHTVEAFGYLWGAMETVPEDVQLQQWNEEISDALMSDAFYNSDTHLFRNAYLGMDRLGGSQNAGDTAFNLAFTYPMFKAWLTTGDNTYRQWILDYTNSWEQAASDAGGFFPMQVDATTRAIGPFTGGDWWRFDDSSQLTRFDYDFYGHNVVSRSLHGAIYAQLLADPNDDGLAQALVTHLRAFQLSALPENPHDSYDPAQGGFFRDSSYRYMPALYSATHAALFSSETQQMIDDYVSAKSYCAGAEREHVEWMEFTYQRGLSEATPEYAFYGGTSDADARINYIFSQPLPSTGDELNDMTILMDGLQYIDGTLWSWSSIRNGAPSTAPLRYFGGDGSIGLPDNVAALVRYYDGSSMELWLYNNNAQSTSLIISSGHYGQNDFTTVNDGQTLYDINDDRVALIIPAYSLAQLDFSIERFVNTPSLHPLQ